MSKQKEDLTQSYCIGYHNDDCDELNKCDHLNLEEGWCHFFKDRCEYAESYAEREPRLTFEVRGGK